MKSAIETIIEKLDVIFVPMDAKIHTQSQEWAKGRCEALEVCRKSDKYQEIEKMGWKYAGNLYEMLHNVAGGKIWYSVFKYGYHKSAIEFVTKNCEATARKRNASIAKKLQKAGATEIISEEYTETNDGFNGVFVVNTTTGKQRVTIDTIYAGGYNIQCLHLRVLVKVRPTKG